jgi:hypothetical protein
VLKNIEETTARMAQHGLLDRLRKKTKDSEELVDMQTRLDNAIKKFMVRMGHYLLDQLRFFLTPGDSSVS